MHTKFLHQSNNNSMRQELLSPWPMSKGLPPPAAVMCTPFLNLHHPATFTCLNPPLPFPPCCHPPGSPFRTPVLSTSTHISQSFLPPPPCCHYPPGSPLSTPVLTPLKAASYHKDWPLVWSSSPLLSPGRQLPPALAQQLGVRSPPPLGRIISHCAKVSKGGPGNRMLVSEGLMI